MRRTMRGNVPEHLRDDALRQVVGLHEAIYRYTLQPWDQTPVTADDPANQADMRQMIQALGLAVALPSGIHKRQVSRKVAGRLVLLEVKRFQRDRYFLSKTDSDKTSRRDCIARSDQSYGFTRGYHLTPLRAARRRRKRVLKACAHNVSSPHLGSYSPCAVNFANCAAGTPALRVPLYCINQPWLTTNDCPVSAAVGKAARNNVVWAISSTVVKTPSTVPPSITFRTTSSSVSPSSRACSGIFLSTSGVRTNPGQTTCERTLCAAPAFAKVRDNPSNACFAVTYADLSGDARCEWTEPI